MTVLVSHLSGGFHFPVRLACAIAALLGVALWWMIGVPDVQNRENATATISQECETDECAQIWIRENLSNIQYPIGVLPPEASR